MSPALVYFRRVPKETDNTSVEALALERKPLREALRILYTPYAPFARGIGPLCVRPEGMSAASGIFRTLSRIVEEAARAESSFLRVSDACYGYLTRYSMPSPKAEAFGSPKTAQPVKPATVLPIHPVYPAGEESAETKAGESGSRTRSRSPRPSGPVPFEINWGRRCVAWVEGGDPQGPFRGLCKNCYPVTGKRAPRHIGASGQNLGSPFHLPCRLRKCQGSDVCHRAEDCPNKD